MQPTDFSQKKKKYMEIEKLILIVYILWPI